MSPSAQSGVAARPAADDRATGLDHPSGASAQALDQVELTVLMPCLNEQETIEVCVRKARAFMQRAGVRGEVLIADNGSTDGSQALAAEAGARVVPAAQKGYGAALLAGIAAARGRYIIMGDADDSYDLENLDGMLDTLRSGAELVMGNRFAGGIAPGAMPPLHRYLGNPVLSFIGRLLFPAASIGDFHCGLRGFSRDAINSLHLQSTGMEFASEMVVKASLHRLKIAEVPTTLKPDGRSRPPHLNTWRDGWRHLRFLLIHSPRWLFLYPGLALVAVGVVASLILASGQARISRTVALDVHTLIASAFAIVIGTQLVMFGALARRYSISEGFLPSSTGLRKFLLGVTLETILQGAALVFVGGLAGTFWAFYIWAMSDFGPIPDHRIMRVLVLSLTAVTVAVQLGAAGFLASMLSIRHPRT